MHAHLEAQDFESRAFKCRDYASGGDLNTETGEIPPDRGNHATRVTRSARMHPGIPRRVRCVTRHLASAPVCGRVIAKEGADRSLRDRGKRRPGKQPGEPGTTMNLAADPDERFAFPPAASCGCGAGLAGAPVLAQRRHQVTDIAPAPAPKVTEYVAQAKECPGCGTVTEGELPAHVRARASFGPETCAQAANLTAGHHIPVYRSTLLLCQLAGIAVSTGWMAGIRGRAASLVEASGFMDRVRELLKTAPAVHADETPARAAGGTRYVHLACTRYLTCMHTGDRSADAIDAGGVLPGYCGVIVRDGYAGYGHLTDALHAWCGVHLLRDLKGLYDFEPSQQQWASQMAGLLIQARDAAWTARQAGQSALDAVVLEDLVAHYRALAAAGLAANLYRRTATAKDARRIARRFLCFEDLILRFATRPDLDIFSNNEAERTIRPVKVQQRSSGGCWRTIDGLADFALVQSYLSTAAFSRGPRRERRSVHRVCAAQRLMVRTLPCVTGVVQACYRRVVVAVWLSCVMSSRLAARAAFRSWSRSPSWSRRSAACCSRWVIFWFRASMSAGAPSPDSRHVCSPSASESRFSSCRVRASSRSARSWAASRSACRDARVTAGPGQAPADGGAAWRTWIFSSRSRCR